MIVDFISSVFVSFFVVPGEGRKENGEKNVEDNKKKPFVIISYLRLLIHSSTEKLHGTSVKVGLIIGHR